MKVLSPGLNLSSCLARSSILTTSFHLWDDYYFPHLLPTSGAFHSTHSFHPCLREQRNSFLPRKTRVLQAWWLNPRTGIVLGDASHTQDSRTKSSRPTRKTYLEKTCLKKPSVEKWLSSCGGPRVGSQHGRLLTTACSSSLRGIWCLCPTCRPTQRHTNIHN